MNTIASIFEVRQALRLARLAGRQITFVPTMGALHAGHAALIRSAAQRQQNGDVPFVVVSIFVNPTQFGPNEDFTKYPRTLAADQELCHSNGANLIFTPTAAEMYPGPIKTIVEVGELADHLCGPSRPGHFRGVCTVVLKLLNIVQPDVLILGAKDAQQARIVRRMIIDLNLPIFLQIEPTIREADGLALSSRNRYLTDTERAVAPKIYETLLEVERTFKQGESSAKALEFLCRERLMTSIVNRIQARIDYASVVDDDTLQPIEKIEKSALCAVAVYLGETRLIDNVELVIS